MQISFKAHGPKKAQHLMVALQKMGAAYSGIERHGRERAKGGNNADVKDYLAEGGRDIGPSQEDADKAAREYVKVAEKFLRAQTDAKPPTAAAANQASAKAFRKAAMAVQRALTARVDRGEDMDGPADKVTAAYAKTRKSKFGIPEDSVLKATGQLLANLQGSGGLKLVK